MNVSKNELRKETVQTLRRVNDQIAKLDLKHAHDGGPPVELLAPLLLAKSQCLNTITLLNT